MVKFFIKLTVVCFRGFFFIGIVWGYVIIDLDFVNMIYKKRFGVSWVLLNCKLKKKILYLEYLIV